MLFSLFCTAAFAGAFLLFWTQPLIGKILLPALGGVPAVWNTCMVFFQTALFAGYLYAHYALRLLGPRTQTVLHLVLLLVTFTALPFGVSASLPPPDLVHPIRWLLTALVVSIGLPFTVLAASAPLLQMLYVHLHQWGAERAYSLYAVSNAGSIASLLLYLVVLEPGLSSVDQSFAWTIGYGIAAAAVGACAVLVHRTVRTRPLSQAGLPATGAEQQERSPLQRFRWLSLAFVPSSLLLGVTTHITTDIAPLPLLWVVPLLLYLLTYVLAFLPVRVLPMRHLSGLQVLLVLSLALVGKWAHLPDLIGVRAALAFHLTLFFVTAAVCHQAVADSRPPASHMTEFYVWLSLGGILGGLFNTLVAPAVFTGIVEYPLAIAAAFLLRPSSSEGRFLRSPLRDLAALFVVLAAAGGVTYGIASGYATGAGAIVLRTSWLAIMIFLFIMKQRTVIFGLGIAIVLLSGNASRTEATLVHADRNFFGTHRILHEASKDLMMLVHGSIVHGEQYRDEIRSKEPQSYFSRTEPFGLFYSVTSAVATIERIGVIGLGTGALAAYAQEGQRWSFYEVDPAIARIAKDARYFTYLANSAAPVDVILGDGRLAISQEPDRSFDLLVIDAFSADAIPVHLLTREAFHLYLEKLRESGSLAFHISNKYLFLSPVLIGHAQQSRLDYAICEVTSKWFFASKELRHLERLRKDRTCWQPEGMAGLRNWTDDYSSVLPIMR